MREMKHLTSLALWAALACGGLASRATLATEPRAGEPAWQSLTQAEQIHAADPTTGGAGHRGRGWVVEGKPGSDRHEDGRPVWRKEGDEIICDSVGYGFLRYASQEFDDFVFAMEVWLGPGSNTGVGFRAPPFDPAQPRATRPSVASYELQLRDDRGQGPSVESSGAVYGVFPPACSAIDEGDVWNAVEIACRGPRITITVNGRIVQDFDESDHADLRDRPRSGYLTLQNHDGEVRFRKLRVRRWEDPLEGSDQPPPGKHVVTVDSVEALSRSLAAPGGQGKTLTCVRLTRDLTIEKPVDIGQREGPVMLLGNGHALRFGLAGQLRVGGGSHGQMFLHDLTFTSPSDSKASRLPMIESQGTRQLHLYRIRAFGRGRTLLRSHDGKAAGSFEQCFVMHAPMSLGSRGGSWRWTRCTFVSRPRQAAIETREGEAQTLLARDCVFSGTDAYGAIRVWDKADVTLDHCLLAMEGPQAMRGTGHGRQRECWFVDPRFHEALAEDAEPIPEEAPAVTNPVLALAASDSRPLAGSGRFRPSPAIEVVNSATISPQPMAPIGTVSHRLAHASQPVLGIPDLEQRLEKRWTRDAYIAAYEQAFDREAWDATLRSLRERKTAAGRFTWAELEPVAQLYAVTHREPYLETIQAFLLHEALHPSGDRNFTLSRVAQCFGLVKRALPTATQQIVEACLADHADQCLVMESGTEMNRGILNALGLVRASNLLPDHPHRVEWERTHRRFWREGLARIRDTNEDSTSYNALWLYNVMQYVEAAGLDERAFYAQHWVRELFERHLLLRDPIGIEPHTTGGQPALTAPAIMEWAGAVYRDGRYRWAAQRAFNFLRAQQGCATAVSREPMFVHVDDTVPPIPPSLASFASSRRYDRDFADKLVLRSGAGAGATAVFVNLFHGGGHGLADGSAIYSLMDGLTPVLAAAGRGSAQDAFSNVVQVRRAGDEFPFGSTWRSDTWRRTWINLRAGNTATGGINIDPGSVTAIGLRCDGTSGGTITVKNLTAVGTGRRELLTGPVELPARKWVPFPIPEQLGLADDEAIEFEWMFSQDTATADVSVFVNSSQPSPATSRWYSFLLDTWRESRVCRLGDFSNVSMASIEVDVHDYAGGDHRQTRDLFVIPGELVWVRDRLQVRSREPLQVGPLWHVRDIDHYGNDWVQASTPSTNWFVPRGAAGGVPHWMEAGVPRSMLLVLPRKPGIENGHVLDAADTSGRPHCLFQRWQGDAACCTSVGFNSCLVLRSDEGMPSDLRKRIDVIHDDDSTAILRFRNWRLVDNPDGGMIHQAGIETDYPLVAIHLDRAGRVVAAAGLGGTMLKVDGVRIDVESPGSAGTRLVR